MRHFSIFEPNAYPPQNLIVGRIIEHHPKKTQNDPFERFCSAGIVYRRVWESGSHKTTWKFGRREMALRRGIVRGGPGFYRTLEVHTARAHDKAHFVY